MKTYKGRYKPKNPKKYAGDVDNVVYRSGWERSVMRWCDDSPQVVQWVSEEVVIPYICETDMKRHRYFMDFAIKFQDGTNLLVEVKPNKETKPPKTGKGRAKSTVLKEVTTYVKNTSKWKAAQQFADQNGWKFEIWDEHKLRDMGLLPKPLRSKKPLKKLKPFKRRAKK